MFVGRNVVAYQCLDFVAFVGQLQVELDGGRGELSAQIHDAVHLDIGLVDKVACIGDQVVERSRVDGIVGLYVHIGTSRIAVEGDGAAVLNDEVLADDFLEAELIDSLIEAVTAEELDIALVVELRTYVAGASSADVVACDGVHDDAHRGVGGGIHNEVQTDVRIHFLLLLFLFDFLLRYLVGGQQYAVLQGAARSLVDKADELVADI